MLLPGDPPPDIEPDEDDSDDGEPAAVASTTPPAHARPDDPYAYSDDDLDSTPDYDPRHQPFGTDHVEGPSLAATRTATPATEPFDTPETVETVAAAVLEQVYDLADRLAAGENISDATKVRLSDAGQE